MGLSLKKLIDSLKAIKETPQRIVDAWIDPVRRVHSISRIAESYVPAFVVLFTLTRSWWLSTIGATVITLLEFVFYEWLLEPLKLSGYYWERGPRDDEHFTHP